MYEFKRGDRVAIPRDDPTPDVLGTVEDPRGAWIRVIADKGTSHRVARDKLRKVEDE